MEKQTLITNDTLRHKLFAQPAQWTTGVAASVDDIRFALLDEVCCFENFSADGDEHDFGAIDFRGARYFFKIDDQRTLTIMREDEYQAANLYFLFEEVKNNHKLQLDFLEII